MARQLATPAIWDRTAGSRQIPPRGWLCDGLEAGRYARHDCAAAHMHACVTFEEKRYLTEVGRTIMYITVAVISWIGLWIGNPML